MTQHLLQFIVLGIFFLIALGMLFYSKSSLAAEVLPTDPPGPCPICDTFKLTNQELDELYKELMGDQYHYHVTEKARELIARRTP